MHIACFIHSSGLGILQSDSCITAVFSYSYPALCALVSLTTHFRFRSGHWTYQQHDSLTQLMYAALIVLGISVISIIVFLIVGVVYDDNHGKYALPYTKHTYCVSSLSNSISRSFLQQLENVQ